MSVSRRIPCRCHWTLVYFGQIEGEDPSITMARMEAHYSPTCELTSLLHGRRAGERCGALILLPEREAGRVGRLQQDFRQARSVLAGAIFPALIEGAAFTDRGCWVLPFDQAPPIALVGDLPSDPEQAALTISAAVEPLLPDSPATLFMFFDAMVPNIGSMLEALYLRLADRVAYAGVNAGSETFQPIPCLFDSDRLMGHGVLCVLLPGAWGAALDHGYHAPRTIISATATEGNRILAIDWRPAFEVYREQVRELYAVDLTPENFYRFATHFPFGLLLANDEVIVRIPVALEADGSLHCIGEVPPNAMLTLLRAPELAEALTARRIADLLRRVGDQTAGSDLLTFYCAGRRAHLGASATDELALLLRETGARRLVGALSLGEIGSLSTGGYPLFHNATLVCRPWMRAWNATAS